MINHDLKVMRALTSYVMVMRNGVVVEEGPTAEIFEHPATDYTKALIAAALDHRTLTRPRGLTADLLMALICHPRR